MISAYASKEVSTARCVCPRCGSEMQMNKRDDDSLNLGYTITYQWYGCPYCGPYPLKLP